MKLRLFFALQTAAFSALAAGPTFKVPAPQPIEIANATAGAPYELQLPTLLQEPGVPPRQWSLVGQPGWLSLDAERERLSGFPTAADAGVVTFRLSVRDANGGEPNRQVQLRVVAPPKWDTERLDLGVQLQGKSFTFQLKSHVVDLSGGTMEFEGRSMPAWMTVNASTGIVSGTPGNADVGEYANVRFIARGPGGASEVEAFGEVLSVPEGPKWLQREFTLDDGAVGKAYVKRLDELLLNPSNATLSFEVIADSPPSWVQIGSTTGTLFGTPGTANVGANSISVKVAATINGRVFEDVAVFRFNVKKDNRAPRWRVDPLSLPRALTKRAYRQELLKSVEEPDGDKVTFTVDSFEGPGSPWGAVDATTGVFTGTPPDNAIGKNKFRITAKDAGGLAATATVEVVVDRTNEPPKWKESPIQLPGAVQGRPYAIDLAPSVKDPDGDPLRFDLLDQSTWFQITPTGQLLGTPEAKDAGLISFRVRVSDGVSGSDIAELRLLVERVNRAPEWLLDPVIVTAKQGESLKVDLNVYARDPDGDAPLLFSAIEPPSFLRVTEDGKLLGLPNASNGGEHRFRIKVSDRAGASSLALAIVTVPATNQKPVWASDTIQLPNAVEGLDYQGSVQSYVTDPDGVEMLRFSKRSGPAWLTVNSDGRLSGIPTRSAAGMNTFEVQVVDAGNELAVATVKILVKQENKPPRFRQPSIPLPDAPEDSAYTVDLAAYAVDDDGDKLQWSVSAGPAWLSITPTGTLKGTPTRDNVGPFTVTVSVTDGAGTANASATGLVTGRNALPVISPTLPQVTVRERQMALLALATHVSDPDNDPLQFSLLGTYDWVAITADGELTLSPKSAQVGEQEVAFRVSDGKGATSGKVKVTVTRDARPPIWLEDPMRLDAVTGTALQVSLTDKVRDLDNLPIFFSRRDGPAWVTVSREGVVSGTPAQTDAGTSVMKVAACNDKACGEARLFIAVRSARFVDRMRLADPIEGSSVDVLWVVDTSRDSEALTRKLGATAERLATELDKRGVQARHVVLAADARRFDGMPLGDSAKNWVVPATEVDERVQKAWTRGDADSHSPLRAVKRFLEREPVRRDLTGKFLRAERPLEVIVVTQIADRFTRFEGTDAKLSTVVEQVASRARAGRQPLRVHWLTGCEEVPEDPAKPSALSEVVAQTAGTKSRALCESGTIDSLATSLTARARLLARPTMILSRTVAPGDVPQASLGAVILDPKKLFELDATRAKMMFHWHELGPRTVSEQDDLIVTYGGK